MLHQFDIKPHCFEDIGELSFRKSEMMVLTWRFISLLTTGSTDNCQ